MASFLRYTKSGLYCVPGNFYIDPNRKVDYAVITHGHADHARRGMKNYLTHHITKQIITKRYSIKQSTVDGIEFGEERIVNGVKLSLHPAGHILGSAQVRMEYQGEVAVVTGDYKVKPDGLTTDFEPIKCHSLITESTFGLPIYHWEDEETIKKRLTNWIKHNQEQGATSILAGYSLGKAQRLLHLVKDLGEVYAHSSIVTMNKVLQQAGVELPDVISHSPHLNPKLSGKILLMPPNVLYSEQLKSIPNRKIALCSGWIQAGNRNRVGAMDAGFVISDHSDWQDLLTTVKECEASTIFVTHGYEQEFSRYLCEQGYNAHSLNDYLELPQNLIELSNQKA